MEKTTDRTSYSLVKISDDSTNLVKFSKCIYNCDYEYRRKKNHKKYKIVNDLFYCKEKEQLDPIRMYDNNMVWRKEFKNIAPYLLAYPVTKLGPVCEPFEFTDVPNTPTTMIGKPLFDALTNTTYMVFNFDHNGPVKNDADFPALLINMDNTPDYVFSYHVIPENLENQVKVSFYTLGDPYGFNDYKFWLMLDKKAHFTTYHKLSHTFQVPGPLLVNWICITENVTAMYLTVRAIPTCVVPLCGLETVIAETDACYQNIDVIIGNMELNNNNNLILNYRDELLYSVNRIKKYAQNNTKELLLPIIPPQNNTKELLLPIISPQNLISSEDPPPPPIVGRIVSNIETYYTYNQGYYTVFDNAKYIDGPITPQTIPTTPLPNNLKQDRYNNNSWFGIDTTEFSTKGPYYVLFTISMRFATPAFSNPSNIDDEFRPFAEFCYKRAINSAPSFYAEPVDKYGTVFPKIKEQYMENVRVFDTIPSRYSSGVVTRTAQAKIPQGQSHFILYLDEENLSRLIGVTFDKIVISDEFIPM